MQNYILAKPENIAQILALNKQIQHFALDTFLDLFMYAAGLQNLMSHNSKDKSSSS